MIVLALDQSSKVSGYALFVDGKLCQSGTIQLTDKDIGVRLMQFREEITNFINAWDVEYVVYEDIQMQDNIKDNVHTFKILAEVIGVLEELLTELDIPHEAVLAGTWRKALSIKGYHRSEQKKNAQKYVSDNYGMSVSEDESDAVCIGTYFTVKNNEQDSYDWSD